MYRRTFLKSIVGLFAIPATFLFKNEIDLDKLDKQCDKGLSNIVLIYDETKTPIKVKKGVFVLTLKTISNTDLEEILVKETPSLSRTKETMVIKINQRFILENYFRPICLANQVISISKDGCEVVKSRYGEKSKFSYNSILG